jgi:hypothetical protein
MILLAVPSFTSSCRGRSTEAAWIDGSPSRGLAMKRMCCRVRTVGSTIVASGLFATDATHTNRVTESAPQAVLTRRHSHRSPVGVSGCRASQNQRPWTSLSPPHGGEPAASARRRRLHRVMPPGSRVCVLHDGRLWAPTHGSESACDGSDCPRLPFDARRRDSGSASHLAATASPYRDRDSLHDARVGHDHPESAYRRVSVGDPTGGGVRGAASGDGRRATGDGRRATGDGRRAT